MFEITNRFPHPIFSSKSIPVVSIYLPTHKTSPDNKQDVLVYKNLLKEVEDKLNLILTKKEVTRFMSVLDELRQEKEFWINSLDGICVFSDGQSVIVYKTSQSLPLLAIVSDSFHTKPLRRALQGSEQYIILGLTRTSFDVFLASRFHIEPLSKDFLTRKTLKEVLGDQSSEGSLTFGSYGGASGNGMFHGHGDKSAEIDLDTHKYFKFVDEMILNQVSKYYPYPVVLCTLDEYQPMFRSLSKNPHLHPEGVHKSFETIDTKVMHQESWKIFEAKYAQTIKEFVDQSFALEAKKLASHDLNDIVKAAIEGRVKEICISASAMVYGEIDAESKQIIYREQEGLFDDVMDDLIDIVESFQGKIWVVDAQRLPDNIHVIAHYRY
jgi:hypothetical protein